LTQVQLVLSHSIFFSRYLISLGDYLSTKGKSTQVRFGLESFSNKVQFDLGVFLSLNVCRSMFQPLLFSVHVTHFFQAILVLINLQRLADAV